MKLHDGDSKASAKLIIEGDSTRVADTEPGAVSWDAILVAFNGERLPHAAHRVEVPPGKHTLTLRVQRFTMPWIARYRSPSVMYWEETLHREVDVELEVEAGKVYWLDWFAEWSPEREEGRPPMRFREREG